MALMTPQFVQKPQRVSTGYEPRPWQLEVHRSLKRFNVLVVHRRGGKTVMCINELIDRACKAHRKNGRYGYIAPQRNQAKLIAWEYLKQFTQQIPNMKYHEQDLKATFPNNAFIQLYGADNPDAIRGTYFDAVILDEYADIKPWLWSTVIRPLLTDRQGGATFIGTPKGMGGLYEVYQKALEDTDNWYTAVLPYWETDALDPDEIAQARREMGEQQFAQEFCCDWGASSDNVVIPISIIEPAIGKHIPHTEYALSSKVLGIDVARFGDDRCVIQPRQGNYVHVPQVFENIDNMEFANECARTINEFKPDAVFIDAGRGEGVIDRLRQLGYSVIEVNFGGTPMDKTKYANRRCEMYFHVADALRGGLCLPKDNRYLSELSAPRYAFKADTSVKVLETKESMKKRGIRSPDLADGLALTYAAPVRPRTDPAHHVPQTHKPSYEYDPF